MGETDAKKYDDKPLEKGGENDCSSGPVSKRGCTDILCCIIFVAHWVLFLILAGMAFSDGSPARLIAHRDVAGRHCGQEENWNPWNTDRNTPPWNMKDYEKGVYTMNIFQFLGGPARSVG